MSWCSASPTIHVCLGLDDKRVASILCDSAHDGDRPHLTLESGYVSSSAMEGKAHACRTSMGP
jgi:hypothetical protein